jgi:predicted transcriptional regulator of viral defense system
MEFKDLYKKLEKNKYYVFSFEDLRIFYTDESRENLKKLIYRWKKKGWVSSLKKGLYELTYPADFNLPDLYIANNLYYPSYVSLETALSYYSIIPEVSMAVTSITTKPTRRFKNKHGLFIYRTLKKESFTGYSVEKQRDFDFRIAEREKAIVDYLYFKTRYDKVFNIQEERFDKSLLRDLNKEKLESYAELFNLDLEVLYALL